MAREGLVGSRIRERRGMAGMKQADLARDIGISASYLNLIEHNRRRIGGKLLLDIAEILQVEPSALSEGAEAALIANLREAAVELALPDPEAARAEDFAGRFSGWAEGLAASRRRITELERTVETLTDRLAHDPQLAASVHELLTTAAAIRSTASLLAGSDDMDDIWRKRFHGNLDEDSRRLADTSTALVEYLDADTSENAIAGTPQEEVDAFLEEAGYVFPPLEAASADDLSATIDRLIANAEPLRSKAAQHMARNLLLRAAADAQTVPLDALRQAVCDTGPDPILLSQALTAPLPVVLRRMASLPELEAGLIVTDRAGSLLLRKSAPGFVIPRFGNCCPLWPLFETSGQPGLAIRRDLRQLGQAQGLFRIFAITETIGQAGYNQSPLTLSMMLVLPLTAPQAEPQPLEVGSNCRICPRKACMGRREPSILSEGY